MKNVNDIQIPYCDLDDAVENIIYEQYSEYDETINRESIKRVLKDHLMCAIEDILSEPTEYFKRDCGASRRHRSFWKDLENSVYINDVA